MFPIDKYKFYTDKKNRKVIAVSTYMGKFVKGYAVANPEDEFDEEKGKMLAAARCNEKVARKRAHRAELKVQLAKKQLEEATEYYNKMNKYLADASSEYASAVRHTNNILDKFN